MPPATRPSTNALEIQPTTVRSGVDQSQLARILGLTSRLIRAEIGLTWRSPQSTRSEGGEPACSLCVSTSRRAALKLEHPLCRAAIEQVGQPQSICPAPPCAFPGLGSFLGVPLRDAEGRPFGVVYAVDPAERAWTHEEEHALADLAAIASAEIARSPEVPTPSPDNAGRETEQNELRRWVEVARLAELRGEVGFLLTRRGPLPATLQEVGEAVRRGLQAQLVRIWTHRIGDDVLELQASAGPKASLSGPMARVPVGRSAIGRVARDRIPTRLFGLDQASDVNDRVWVRLERLPAVVAYPLVVEERLAGVIAAYSDQPFPESAVSTLGSIADAVALYIEHKLSEAELNLSEARNTAILQSALDCIVSIDHEGRVIEFNPAAVETFGYQRAEVIGKPIVDLIIPPESRAKHREALQLYNLTGVGPFLGKRTELKAMRANGEVFPVEVDIIAVRHHGPAIFTAYLRDITERKQAETSLRTAAERLDLVLRSADLGLWDWSIPTGEVIFNERWAEMLGYRMEELEPHVRTWENLVHPEDRETVEKALMAHLNGETPAYESEHRLRSKTGEWVWILDRGRVVARDSEGHPLRATGTHLDLTARRRAEASLRQSQSMLSQAEQLAGVGSWLLDLRENRLTWSDSLYRLHGLTPGKDKVDRETATQFIHPGDRERVQSQILQVLNERRPFFETETRVILRGGDLRHHQLRFTITSDLLGRPSQMIGTVLDVTERRRREALLHDRETRLRSVVETAVDGIVVCDDRGRIESFNPAAERLFGYQTDEILGQDVSRLMPMTDRVQEGQAIVQYLQSRVGRVIGRRRTLLGLNRNGSTFPVELAISEMSLGASLKYTLIVRDVTERRTVEESLRRSNALLEAIRRAQQNFITDGRPSQVFEGMLLAILQLTESPCGLIGEFVDQEARPSTLTVHSMLDPECTVWSGERIELRGSDRPMSGSCQWLLERVLHEGRPVLVDESEQNLEEGGQGAGSTGQRFLGLPIRRGDQLLGILAIANRRQGYDQALIDELDPLVATCAGLLEGLRNERRRQQAEVRLQSAKDAADAANRAKSEFLANMSHEVRTPMTAVLGFADMLAEPMLPRDDQDAALQAIRRNARHLMQLLDNILDLSKIEAGMMQLEQIAYSPWQIVLEVVSLLQARATEKGISLCLRPVGELPCWISTDPIRVRQILMNFASNAIKFTESGGTITLRLESIRVEEASEVRRQLLFEVADEGIGMTAAQIQSLFRPFQQADSSTTRKYGGTGLGLSISYRLAEALGGEIRVRSAPGEGSVFGFRLPLTDEDLRAGFVAAAELDDEESTIERANREPHLQGRVLVAEDSVDLQRLIAHYLEALGIETRVVNNGRAAVDLAQKDPYDLILMDLQMPELDGYGAVRTLRRLGYAGPIIALTAHALQEDKERCLQIGFNGYLTKPVDRSVLTRTVSAFTEIRAQPPARIQPKPESPTEDPELDFLIRNYVNHLDSVSAKLGDSFTSGDREAARKLAHQIRGSGGMYGFAELSEAAALIEQAIVESRDDDLVGELIAEFQALVETIQGDFRAV